METCRPLWVRRKAPSQSCCVQHKAEELRSGESASIFFKEIFQIEYKLPLKIIYNKVGFYLMLKTF